MRVLLICDRFFVRREHPLLERLEIGLADEGVRLTVAVPERTELQEQLTLLSGTVTYRMNGVGWTKGLRAAWLLEGVGRVSSEKIDLVHVFGGAAWGVGVEAAGRLQVPAVLEVWRAGLAGRARAFAARHPGRVVLSAPDPAVERELRRQSGGAPVRLTPWGVSAPPEPVTVFREGRTPAIVLVGQARNSVAYLAAFKAAGEVVRELPEALLFADAVAARRAPLWKLAKEMGVRGRLSLIDEMEAQRGLALHGDVLLYPEAQGEQRTVLLDAMAAGMPIVAHEDPAVSSLIDQKTAVLVRSSHVEEWREAVRSVVQDRERARALGASAREWVREHRRSSAYIASVLGLYEWTVSSDAIPFAASKAGAA